MVRRKWIRLKSPRERVHAVCARMLRSRLKAIAHYLPLVASKSQENVEYVHQLRVWTRRADAVVDLCRKILRKKDRRHLSSQLDVLRGAAGGARDADVLHDRIVRLRPGLGREHLLKVIDRRRRAAQQPVMSASEQLSGGKELLKLSACIIERYTMQRQDKPFRRRFRKWAAAQLVPIRKRFIKRGNADLQELRHLHRFRIAGKQLRYALELAWDALDKRRRKRAYRLLSRLQMQLGAINDGLNLINEIEQALATVTKRPLQAQLRRLLAAEHRRLTAARESWQQRWSGSLRKRLEKQLRLL